MNLEGLWYKTGAKHLTCGSEVNCPEFLASRLTMAFFQLSELSRSRKLQWDEIHVHSQYRQHILKEKSRLISKSACQFARREISMNSVKNSGLGGMPQIRIIPNHRRLEGKPPYRNLAFCIKKGCVAKRTLFAICTIN